MNMVFTLLLQYIIKIDMILIGHDEIIAAKTLSFLIWPWSMGRAGVWRGRAPPVSCLV